MSVSIFKFKKTLLMAGGLLLLSGCAVSPDECQSWNNDVSIITKLRCDTLSKDNSGYQGEVRQREQELQDAKAENELFHQVYQDIIAQQGATKLTLADQRQQQQRLDKSLTKLMQQLKGRHGSKSEVVQQIGQLEDEMAMLRNQTQSNNPAVVAKKQAELKALQQKVSRLQLSLGY